MRKAIEIDVPILFDLNVASIWSTASVVISAIFTGIALSYAVCYSLKWSMLLPRESRGSYARKAGKNAQRRSGFFVKVVSLRFRQPGRRSP